MPPNLPALSDRVIVALDYPDVASAQMLIDAVGDTASFYKIGHQLAFAGGLDLARRLREDGKRVFLDMKLLDIDNTIAGGVASIAALGVDMLTIHAYPKAMRAAVTAKQKVAADGLALLGVSVLTSMDDDDLEEAGYGVSAQALVRQRAEQAVAAGMDGLVCSAEELADLRQDVSQNLALIVPGIRPAGSARGDQKRVMTPKAAMSAGATHLVIGRPITQAVDPQQAFTEILAEVEAGLSARAGLIS